MLAADAVDVEAAAVPVRRADLDASPQEAGDDDVSDLSGNDLYDSTLLVDKEWMWALLAAADDMAVAAFAAADYDDAVIAAGAQFSQVLSRGAEAIIA